MKQITVSGQAGWKISCVVTATILLCALSPLRADASALSERSAGPERSTGARTVAAALTQSPLVMRMSKDEFRIAFGIKSVGCAENGCRGAIRYRVNWKAEDGTIRRETREVSYAVAPHSAARTIAVDRQYFDTAEGAHTTDVVEVTVDQITVAADAAGNLVSQLSER